MSDRFAGRRARRAPMRLVVALVAAVALLGSACTDSGDNGDEVDESASVPSIAPLPPLPELDPLEPGVLRIGVTSLGTVDPALVSPAVFAELAVADLLFEGLTAWDAITATVVPGFATSWEADEELTTWTFQLDTEARFGDATPVTALEVQATLDRVVTSGSPLAARRLEMIEGHDDVAAGDIGQMTGIQVIDEHTLVIRTTEPSASLPEVLSAPSYGIVPAGGVVGGTRQVEPAVDDGEPAEGAEGSNDEPGDDAGSDGAEGDSAGEAAVLDEEPAPDGPTIGSGAFRLVSSDWRVMRLEPVESADVSLEAVELVVFDDAEQALEAHREGRLDLAMVPPTEVPGATQPVTETLDGDRAVLAPLAATVLWAFDLRHPQMADLRVREAISLAIDRDGLLATTLAGTLPMHGVVPFGVPGGPDEPCELCRYDPDRARALVAEAVADGFEGPVVIDTYDDPAEAELGEKLKVALEAVGLAVELRLWPYAEYEAQVVGGQDRVVGDAPAGPVDTAEPSDIAPGELRDRQVFLFAWASVVGDAEATLAPLFVSGSPDNVTGLAEPMTDLVVLSIAKEADVAARRALIADANRAVSGAVAVVPLATLATPLALGERVNGVLPRPDGTLVIGLVQLED